MSYDVYVFGTLQFPDGGVASWKESNVDPLAFTDWKGAFETPPPWKHAPRVAALLSRWRRWQCEPGQDFEEIEFLRVRVSATRVKVRGFLHEPTYRDMAAALGAFVRSAAEGGARGHVVFEASDGAFGYVIHLANGTSRFSDVPRTPRPSDERARAEIDELLHERLAVLGL